MELSYAELIRYCIEVLDSFQSESVAVERHLDLYFKDLRSLDDVDKTFIVEVFTGCVRFCQMLDVVVDGYMNSDGKSVSPSERNLYKVFAYLVLFRLEELGIQHYSKFVRSQELPKMCKFLNFFFNESNITTWMKDGWNSFYDANYVNLTILSPFICWLPELLDVLTKLEEKIECEKVGAKSTRPLTESKPFNLAPSKPLCIPMPQRIPKMAKHRHVPMTTYCRANTDEELIKAKLRNWEKAQESLCEMNKRAPACSKTGKSEKTKWRMAMIMAAENNKLNFNKSFYDPMSCMVTNCTVPIKLNAAAILREGRLYQKREEEVIKKLEELEAGSRDTSAFLEWQSKMKQQDMQKRLEEIEWRRLSGKLSQEEAIVARLRVAQENKEKVTEMKDEAARLMQIYMMDRLEEEERIRKRVEKVMSMQVDSKIAKQKMQCYKARIVMEMQEEMRELMRQALEDAEIEMKQRLELIHQIREMESGGRAVRQKLIDFTETSGYGFLCEMSIAELRQRLSLMQMDEETQRENKRNEIFCSKQVKEQLLLDTLETISRHRTETSKAAALKSDERKRTRLEKKKPTNETLMEMERRIEEKKVQRMQKNSNTVPDKNSLQRFHELNSAKKMTEEKRWRQVEHGSGGKQLTICQSSNQTPVYDKSRLALLAL